MKIYFFSLLYFTLGTIALQAQKFIEIPLYESIPDSSNIDIPLIHVYLPSINNGAAVIICPGGGYKYLEMNKEGSAYVPWFNNQGLVAIVLKYRLPNGQHKYPLQDVQKAMQIIISHAKEWNIDIKKIGIMGSSAGGHLASTLSARHTIQNRPAFQILLYPVISMDTTITHLGSYHQLLGNHPSKTLVNLYCNELQVNAQTPPAFITLCHDDKTVSPENSIRYYQALLKNSIPAEMHIYPKGGHGFAFNENFKYINPMLTSLKYWLSNTLENL